MSKGFNSQKAKEAFVPVKSRAEMEQESTNKVVLSHPVTTVRQFSNAWLIQCGCGELFTGKGNSYPVSVRKHLFESAEVVTI